MMKFTRLSVALLLVALLLSCIAPLVYGKSVGQVEEKAQAVASASHSVTSQKQYTVWKGMTETELILKSASGSRIEGHMMEIAPGAAVTAKVSYPGYYKKGSTPESRKSFADNPVWSKKTTTGQAADFTAATGQPVIFSINTDNFITESTVTTGLTVGQCCGHLIMEGNICQTTEHRARPFFAVLQDGSFAIRDANADLSDVIEATSGRIYIVKDGKNVVDPAHSEELGLMPFNSIGLKKDGTVVVFQVDGRRSDSVGFTEMEMAEYLLAQGVYTALILDGGGSATFASRREGDSELTLRNQPSDGTERALGSTLHFMSNEDALYFDYAADTASKDRYKSFTYNGNNFDTTAAWKPTAGTADSVSVDTATGMMTISKSGANTLGYTYVQTQAASGKALRFRPDYAHWLQIRMELKGFDPATASTNFSIHYYADGATTQTTNAVRHVFGTGYVFDGRSLLLTLPVAQKFRDAEFIDTVKINFSNLSGEGTIAIDYLYMGPKASLPEQDFLYFDFQGTPLDADRYGSKTYGCQNFDKLGWGYNGKKSSAPILGNDELRIDVVDTTDNYVNTGHSPYIHTVGSSGSMTAPALRYRPGEKDYLQLRFRMKDCTAVSGLTPMIRFYFSADGTGAFTGNVKKDLTVAEMTSDTYYVVTLPLYTHTAYEGAEVIDYFRLNFQNVCTVSEKTGEIAVDYIYVGPWESLPQQDRIFMDFTDDAEAELRYRSKTYGFQNYDKGSWAYNGRKCEKPTFSDGSMVIAIAPTTDNYVNTGHSPYVQTSDIHAAISRNVLRYKPGTEDLLQIRFKMENCVAVSGKTAMLRFFYTNDDSASTAGYVNRNLSATEISSGNVMTVTLPLHTADAYVNSEYIRRLQITMQNLRSADGQTGKIYVDYIYVGPEAGLPTPQYTVTFVGADGKILTTKTVHKGETVAYTGATPTKTSDASHHYTFKGWDKALTNITEDTVITATYSATAHTWTYSKADTTNHKNTCACGYSKNEVHSYTEGSCICGATENQEPVEETAWKIGHTLNLASDISVSFAISKASLDGFDMDTVYLLAKVDAYEGNVKTGVKTVKLLPTEKNGYYYFTLDGLTAVNMNDKVYAVIYGTKDGQVHYSPADEYSIAEYAYSQLNKTTPGRSLKTLCADLLRYGATAQIYKSYRTDALADSAMTEEHKAFLSNIDAVEFGNNNTVLKDLDNAPIRWEGKSLDLASKVCLKLAFSLGTYTGEVSDLTLRVSYEDIYGEAKTLTVPEAELYNSTYGLYTFTLDSLLVAELRSVLSAQIYAGDSPVSCTLQYSPDTYGNNKEGKLLELCKTLIAYSDSAKAFFMS